MHSSGVLAWIQEILRRFAPLLRIANNLSGGDHPFEDSFHLVLRAFSGDLPCEGVAYPIVTAKIFDDLRLVAGQALVTNRNYDCVRALFNYRILQSDISHFLSCRI